MKRGGVIVLKGIKAKPDWEAGKPSVKRKASRNGSFWKPRRLDALGNKDEEKLLDMFSEKKTLGLWGSQREELLLET